jgi:hypothetical protein
MGEEVQTASSYIWACKVSSSIHFDCRNNNFKPPVKLAFMISLMHWCMAKEMGMLPLLKSFSFPLAIDSANCINDGLLSFASSKKKRVVKCTSKNLYRLSCPPYCPVPANNGV